MFNSDTFANRPAFGIVGRIFISTDTKEFYRDTGTSWELIGGPGSGTITGSGAATQIAFWNSASTITGSNNLWYDSTNSYLGVNTNAPGNPLDVHGSISSVAALNQTTATNNTLLSLLNSGTPLWRIGNFYTAGANDFGIFDVVNTLQQLTIVKATGQTFIGAKTTASGRLVVNSATADNHLQIVGANAPSIRIDNAGSGGTQRFVFGLATATNNFIQGATAGEFCISTQSAGNMLFGMWQTTNASEVMRITTANNLLIGSTTDNGNRLQVTGNGNITGNLGIGISNPLYKLQILDGGGASLVVGATIGNAFLYADDANATLGTLTNSPLRFVTNNVEIARFTGTGNLLVGTTTDGGQKLQVNGNCIVNRYLINTAGGANLYNIVDATDTFTGTYSMQAGGGSSGFGGSITCYGHSNATKPGWIEAGISALSGGKFIVNSTAIGSGGTALFLVSQIGQVNIPTTSTYATNALALAGGLVIGDIYKTATGQLQIVF
jgi:hypothetical protein